MWVLSFSTLSVKQTVILSDLDYIKKIKRCVVITRLAKACSNRVCLGYVKRVKRLPQSNVSEEGEICIQDALL